MKKSKRTNKKMKAHNASVEQKLFGEMAGRYVQDYGKVLMDEARTLENMTFPGIDRLDKRIRNKTLYRDIWRRAAVFAIAAAAIAALFFLL